MNLDLPLLRTFVAIVDHGNFLAAAKAIGRSPSAVSVQIKRLEDAIGHPLLARDARATKLTPAGEKLLPHAHKILAHEAALMADFQIAPVRGAVRLGVPDDVVERFPMQALTRFNDEHPGITLTITVGHTPGLLGDVEAGRIDLAIVTYAESIPGIVSAECLFREPEVWAASTTGIACERDPLPVAVWDEGWAWHEPTIRLLEEAQINFNVVLQCENIGARKAAIRADLAVGPLPVSQLDDEVGPAPNLQHLRGLPEYGLGLKLADDASDAVEAVANHLRESFAGRRLSLPNGRSS